MFNPFVNRSIEQIRDETTFLSVVTPDPLEYFLRDKAEDRRLYTRLVQIFGPPGTGKTTIARLLEFPMIVALLRHLDIEGFKETLKALIGCQAIDDEERPSILGFRLGLEGQYRQIWELPYREELRSGLLQSLIQARTVQGCRAPGGRRNDPPHHRRGGRCGSSGAGRQGRADRVRDRGGPGSSSGVGT
jgi:hypothetical protein